MLELLGTACVGWTLFELGGLLHSARDRSACARRASSRRPGRARRFDAWDDQGNRIVVEDLGAR